MDLPEIRDQVARLSDTPSVVRFEKYEDSERYTGPMFGERSAAPSVVGLALEKALGLDREQEPLCDCVHCECGR